ncbi:MAG TPA: pitrilysin family protein [Armatimonadota bacterium]|nr:pitrilysin family protein [Armatimonadota bacterium]
MHYDITEFHTGLPAILSRMPETPRIALAVTINGGVRREVIPGTAKLASRLLLKGTETRSAEEIALELDERAIDLREVTLSDSTLLLAVFLNRELPAVLNLLEDIIFHSTFADFDKEVEKLIGEIQASLDLPSEIAMDLLTRTLFAGYPYGNTGTRMLEHIAELTPDIVRDWFYDGLHPAQMNVTMVGDFDPDDAIAPLDEAFSDLYERLPAVFVPTFTPREESTLVTQARPDAQQAQVYQGWFAPPSGSEEQAALSVMNTILGGAGLSARLFVELRDRQGLAYSVRSQYVPMRESGEFLVSIGTSPENIDRARKGFAEQIARMQQEPISLDELQNAKGRLRGTFTLAHETTSQRCLDLSINHINGLGPDYSERLLQKIEGVTVADVQQAAQQIQPPSVTAIVAREDALPAS